jgi:hypothetical protein
MEAFSIGTEKNDIAPAMKELTIQLEKTKAHTLKKLGNKTIFS